MSLPSQTSFSGWLAPDLYYYYGEYFLWLLDLEGSLKAVQKEVAALITSQGETAWLKVVIPVCSCLTLKL